MAILTILHAPDKRLSQKAKPVERVDAQLIRLLDDMLETMYAAPGIGLAAPQVGVPLRVIVLDVAYNKEDATRDPIALINPEILAAEGELTWEEGCLSVPDYMAEVDRSAWVRVKALDYQGREVILEAEGLKAVCLQHEIDHLDGTLFIDRISRIKRAMVLKKLKKKQEKHDD